MPKGNIFVISAPSGAGKSSLVNSLIKLDSQIRLSISHTSREIRYTEKDNVDYFFITKDEFEQRIKNKQFLEYAKVYDNYYGTDLPQIKQFLNSGLDIILEIDYQGASQIKKLLPQSVLIYILPPSKKELENRLITRNTDNIETIKKRLALAEEDISHAKEFEYVIINYDFNVALQDLYSIIRVKRMKSDSVLVSYKFK